MPWSIFIYREKNKVAQNEKQKICWVLVFQKYGKLWIIYLEHSVEHNLLFQKSEIVYKAEKRYSKSLVFYTGLLIFFENAALRIFLQGNESFFFVIIVDRGWIDLEIIWQNVKEMSHPSKSLYYGYAFTNCNLLTE